MFGRPRAANASVIIDLLRRGLTANAQALKQTHPTAEPQDCLSIMIWPYAFLVHALVLRGNVNQQTLMEIGGAFFEYVSEGPAHLYNSPDDYLSAFDQCQKILIEEVHSLNHDEIRRAHNEFYASLCNSGFVISLDIDIYQEICTTSAAAIIAVLGEKRFIR